MVALGCSMLVGCAQQAVPAETTEVLSDACGMDIVYDWDGTPGPATPEGAVESILAWFTQKADELDGVEADPLIHSPEQDPVLAKIAIRALTELRAEAAQLDVDASQGASYELFARTDDGLEFGQGVVSEQTAGGYRLESFRAQGLVTDHPDC
jgi:hypothetical protein